MLALLGTQHHVKCDTISSSIQLSGYTEFAWPYYRDTAESELLRWIMIQKERGRRKERQRKTDRERQGETETERNREKR